MNAWDYLLLLLLAAALVLALRALRRQKKRGGCSCGGNCSGCSRCCAGDVEKAAAPSPRKDKE